MFDDQDDKIRRNLFVYSSLVIAAWWLGISPLKIASSKLDFLADVSAVKMLWLTLCVQSYLLLRYRFSRLARRAWKEFTVEVGRLVRSRVSDDINNRLENFRLNGRSNVFDPQLSEYVDRDESERLGKDGGRYRMVDMWAGSTVFKTAWTGDINCVRSFKHDDGSYGETAGGFGLKFAYDRWAQFVIGSRAALTVLFYTRGAVEMLLPVVLGAISTLIICSQLSSF